MNTPRYPAGYEQVTIDAITAEGLASIPTNATYAIIKSTTHDFRYRDDGTSPTSASGFPVGSASGDGGIVELDSAEKIEGFRAIGTVDANSVLEVIYYKRQA
jgi:hypothetical protein